jgi:membrane peptidoglycan carboxypeptidase
MASTLLLAPAAAAAEPVYFHKANVERETFEADLSECVELAGGVRSPRQFVPYSPNVYAAAAGAFLASFMASKQQRQMTKNVLRTCMTDKGYRRVEATEAVSDELRTLDKAERAARLFTLAASPEPVGRVLPQ